MTILLAALLTLSSHGLKPADPGDEIFLRTDRTVRVEQLAAAVRPYGRIESRERGTSVYRVQLKKGVSEEKAKERFGRVPGIQALATSQEPVDMQSLRSIDRTISHRIREKSNDHSRVTGELESKGLPWREADGDSGVDYLQAYRYFVGQRAFPNDSVDWDSLVRGRNHANSMVSASRKSLRFGGMKPDTSGWSFVGPTNLAGVWASFGVDNGRIDAVAFDPHDPNTLYVGGASGGLWKSSDGGTTWTWLSSTWSQLGVNCIAIDPTDSKKIFVGRGDYHGNVGASHGIVMSADGGSTWTEISSSSIGEVCVNSILIDPTNAQTLVAGTGGNGTNTGFIYRSIDGGRNWNRASVGGVNFTWPSLASSAANQGKVRFYSVAGGLADGNRATSRVYKSDDHGMSWQTLSSPLTTGSWQFCYEIAASPTNPNNVYVLDSQGKALYTSYDQGATWTNVSSTLPTGSQYGPNTNFNQWYYDYHLECGTSTNNGKSTDVIYIGQIDIAYSLDGGITWTDFDQFGGGYHVDQHCLAVCPTNPNLVLFTNDGGVNSMRFNTNFSGGEIRSLNRYLGNTMFYHIAMHPSNPDIMLGGTQDNGSPYSSGNIFNWGTPTGGDGGGCAINQTNPLIQYTSSQNYYVYRTADGWKSAAEIGGPNTFSGNLPFVGRIVLDPKNQNLMYTGTNYLYQWNESTQKWLGPMGNQSPQGLTNGNNGAVLQAIAVAPTDSNRIYTGSSDGALWMTTDQGATWRQLNTSPTSLPNLSITSISVSPSNSSDILVGLSGSGTNTGHLYRCANTLGSTIVFANVSGTGPNSIPDVSLNAIVRDLTFPSTTWWVGMDVGVFVSVDSGATWVNAGSPLGLPNTIVSDLVAVSGTGYIDAGLYGRGMWRLQIGSGTSPNLISLTLSPTTVTPGANSTGTVTLSTNAPSGGVVVKLSSGDTSVATVPSTVTISAGSNSATFLISTNAALKALSTSTINASYNGITLTQTLTVGNVSSLQLNAPWPKFHQNNLNTGVGVGSGSNGLLKWTYQTGYFIWNSNPAIAADGTIYVGSADWGLYAFSPEGGLKWRFQASGGVDSSPAIRADGTVYVLAGDGGLSAVTPAGRLLWRAYAGTGGFHSSPAIGADGTVYVGSSDNNLYAFTSSGSLKWKFPTGGEIHSSPAVGADGTIYVGSRDHSVYAVNSDGSLRWAYKTGWDVESAPVVTSNGTVYVGSNDRYVYSISSTGTLNWKYPTNGNVYSSPALAADGTIYVGSEDHGLYALNPLGSLKWKYQTGGMIDSSPAISSDGTVYIGSNDFFLYAISPAGSLVWRYQTGGAIVSSPAIDADGTIYVGSEDDSVYAIGTQGVGDSVSGLSIDPNSVTGGVASSGTVTLVSPAPTGGTTVALSSSEATVGVPGFVIVPGGSATVTFPIATTPVSASIRPVITATAGGKSVTANLAVNPPALVSLTLAPSSLTGGSSSVGTILLNGNAPASGIAVSISSNSASASVQTTVAVGAGATSATFPVKTSAVSTSTTVTIQGSEGGATQSATLTLSPATLVGLTLVPSAVVGGTSSTGTITLNGPAGPGGSSVNLTSTNGSAAVPSPVVIPAGATFATFTVGTSAVSSTTVATIKATLGGNSQSATLTISSNPLLIGFSISPSVVPAGVSSTGTVSLKSAAPTGGVVVGLASASTSVATVPSSVTVVAGATSASFTISTNSSLTTTTSVVITATYNGVSLSQTLTVTPLTLQANAPWPKFHQNTQNIGVGVGGGSNGLIRWSYKTNGSIWNSSPAIASDGTVYVGSADWNLYAFTPSGQVKWKFNVGNSIDSSPAVRGDGVIYVMSGTGFLYAITPNGSLLWKANAGGVPLYHSSPSIAPDGTVYVGSSADWNLYAFAPDGSVKWTYATKGILDSSPAIGTDGTVYVGSQDGFLYAVNPNGSLQWKLDLGGPVWQCSPAVGPDGTIYIGGGYGPMNAVSRSGVLLWRFGTGNTWLASSPAIGGDGTVYFGSGDNNVYAVTPSGQLKWKYLTGNQIDSSPAIGLDGIIYIGSHDGFLDAFTPSGSLLWSYKANGGISSSPSIGSDGTVYVGSWDGNLYALGTQVNTVPITSLTLNPSTILGGNPSTGTITLSSSAPAGGDIVKLSSSDSSATVPALVSVPGGATAVTFTILTSTVTSSHAVVITAVSGGSSTSAGLTVNPPSLTSLSVAPNSLQGGNTSIGTVNLDAGAPIGGLVVSLASASANATAPASVTIPAGATSATFTVSTAPVSATTSVSMTGTLGTVSQSATLTINPPGILGLAINPASVLAGSHSTGTVTLSGPAGSNGASVNLSSSNANVTVPATVAVPSGTSSTTFTINTVTVSAQVSATISASLGGVTQTGVLTVTPSSTLAGIAVNPVSVTGGSSSVGTATLNGPAGPGGVVVNLSSSSSSAALPATVTVASGSSSATFAVSTTPVGSLTTTTITGTQGGATQTAVLTVTPPGLTSLGLVPSWVLPGSNATGTVTLSGAAPTGGIVVALGSSVTTVATVPNTVTVQPGATGTTFAVATNAGLTTLSTSSISASLNGVILTQPLTVDSSTLGSNSPWPKFRQNNQNTGIGVGGGSNGLLRWSYKTNGSIWNSTPAIASDGTVYLGSSDSNLYAFTPTGQVKWSFSVGNGIDSSPAIRADGVVYVMSGAGFLYAITPTGSMLWKAYAGGVPLYHSSPSIAPDGTVYVGSSADWSLYAFAPDGSVKWTYQTNGILDSSPAIGPDGTVYMGSQDHYLYAINSDGTLKWTFPTGWSVRSSPVIGSDGTVYIGSDDSYLYAVGSDGTLKWKYQTGGYIYSSAAIGSDGTVYFGSGDHYLYAISPTGRLFWKYQTGNYIESSPSIGLDGTIYIGSGDNNLYAVNPAGVLVWKYQTGRGIISSPSIGTDGTVYVGSEDNSIYAIGTEVNTVPISGLTLNPSTLVGGNPSTGTITISSAAPAGGDIVKLSSSDSSVAVPALVTVPGGATTVTFAISTNLVTSNHTVVITAVSGGANVTATLLVQPLVASLVFNPTEFPSGGTATGTVTLNSSAGAGGTVVFLSNSNPSVVAVPASITVASGANSASFTATALPVTSAQTATITALAGGSSANAVLMVNPANLLSVSISSTSVVGGNNPAGGTVTLASAAPTGGALVYLSSSNSCVTIPASVVVPAGSTSATFSVKTSGVDVSTAVTVTATYGSSAKTCVLTVLPAWIYTVAVAPTSVVGGGTIAVTGTANLIGQAGPSGTVVSLSSSNTSIATVPATVSVPAGALKSTFVVTTKAVTTSQSVTITATALGKSATATLTVNPSNLASITIAPTSLVGGNTPNGTVTLVNAAPTGGAIVTLTSTSASVKIPATVTVPAGATSVTFAVPTAGVDVNLTATITANLSGATKTCTLTLLPAWILSVTASPTTIAGGNPISASANLIGQAGPSGTVVTLISSNPAVATVPASVTVVAGTLKVPFTITTLSVATTQTVTITGTALGKSATLTITVTAADLASISTSTTSLVGGNSPNGTVTLTGPAPSGGIVVNLKSSNLKATVPASVTVAAGSKAATFAIPTSGVDISTPITLTATLGSTAKTCTLTLQPAWPMTLTVSPSSVKGGSATAVSGKVALNGRSGPSGTVVTLTSSDPTVVSVPATVSVGANGLNTTFTLTTFTVTSTQTITITATANGKSVTTTLTVTP